MLIEFNDDALDVVILSAVEKFHSEVIGVLFGQYRSKEEKYLLSVGMPLSSAHTTFTEANYIEKRIKNVLDIYPQLRQQNRRFLGFYHSHTQLGDTRADTQMSEVDQEAFIGTPETRLEIIIAINKKKRTVDWSVKDKGKISGTCADYFFKLAGYYKTGDNSIKPAKMILR